MPDDTSNAGGTGNSEQAQDQGQGVTFDVWITEQPDDIQDMFEAHTSGLRNALSSERDARKTVEKQLRDLAGKAEKGSELERQLNDLVGQQAAIEQKADFYEQAHVQGVTNLKLAYLVASQESYIDSKGRINWDGMRKGYPELFGQPKVAAGNAGSGTGGQAPTKTANQLMNDFILRGSR